MVVELPGELLEGKAHRRSLGSARDDKGEGGYSPHNPSVGWPEPPGAVSDLPANSSKGKAQCRSLGYAPTASRGRRDDKGKSGYSPHNPSVGCEDPPDAVGDMPANPSAERAHHRSLGYAPTASRGRRDDKGRRSSPWGSMNRMARCIRRHPTECPSDTRIMS